MFPLDWQTMKAPRTGEVEERKCAKPFTDSSDNGSDQIMANPES